MKNFAEEDLERMEISQHDVHRLSFPTDFEFYILPNNDIYKFTYS